MSVEHSVEITRALPQRHSGSGDAATRRPEAGRVDTPVDAGEPGSWSLLLVPVAICLGLLVFSALFGQV
jgi:hypothetical protein